VWQIERPFSSSAAISEVTGEFMRNILKGGAKKMGTKKSTGNKDFIDELSAMLPKERVKRAEREAEKEIFQIRLSELRELRGIRQEDIKNFSQSSVSKLESRRDMKISTLINYLDNLGLGVEIKAYPKDKTEKEEFVLLKV
jgi:hypothetical protein